MAATARKQADGPQGPAHDAWAGPARLLAPWAMRAEDSAGRVHPEPDCPMRTPFQRDRDRIVHATAFRRLTYKTQVFVFHEGDHYRTRLTHSLEVAQIARAIARMLGLDQDLAEALALAHDLGHPPYGHAGERALAAVMAPYGGFDHNAQSFKVVTRLERKYAGFDGLNLTFETLEGLAKHNGPLTGRASGEAVLRRAIEAVGIADRLQLSRFAPAEAQAAAIADDIAYSSHDLDDGLRARLIDLDRLGDVPLAGPFVRHALIAGVETQRVIYEINRRIISSLIDDAVRASRERLAALPSQSADGVRGAAGPVVDLSLEARAAVEGLKDYLYANVYRHPRVMAVMVGAEQIVRELFERYMTDPALMPPSWHASTQGRTDAERAQVVADFVAGMTDRYAEKEHRRLFDATPDLR
jgi:dGTPase